MRALHDRAAHRDFIDVHAAGAHLSRAELERLGARHTVGFSLEELADRLGSISILDDRTFLTYGLDESDRATLLAWATAWETDIRLRLAAGETGPLVVADNQWDAYLDG